MTDAELTATIGCANAGYRGTAWQIEAARRLLELVAEVRRLRVEKETLMIRSTNRHTEICELKERISDVAPLTWTTTPPGPEHEGQWFWVRYRNGYRDFGRWLGGRWVDQFGAPMSVIAWAGPLAEPVGE